jgi:dsRNA-specific ribonuclease
MVKVVLPEMDDQNLRDRAWVGDALLALYAREWLLQQGVPPGESRGELFTHFTSNQFLSALGDPTRIEAKIGLVYREEGKDAAFLFISEVILPLFLRQMQKRGGWHAD